MSWFDVAGSVASIVGLVQQNKEFIGKITKTMFPSQEEPLKDEIAIVLEITQSCRTKVESFLQRKNIDASIVSIGTKDGGRYLDPNVREEWEDVVREYYKIITSIQEKTAPKKIHLFFSAPACLTFAIGCMVRTLYQTHVYNHNGQSYDLVLVVNDELRR